MLTSFVTAVVFTNVMAGCSLCWAVILTAVLSSEKKASALLLTENQTRPCPFSALSAKAGRLYGTARPTREDLQELPSAA